MAKVEGRIADDLTLDEVLEQMLPLCDDDPFDVADWLNERLRRGKIRLLADGIPKPPYICATELVVVAKIASDGRATLEVMSRLDDAMAGIGNTIDTMGNRLIGALAHRATVKAWTVERKSFEDSRPDAPRNRGGREREVNRERLLTEALIYTAVHSWPDHLDGEGGLFEKLAATIKNMPGRTTFYEIFTPVVKRIEAERNKLGKKPKPPAR
jgi:hypothetical protein